MSEYLCKGYISLMRGVDFRGVRGQPRERRCTCDSSGARKQRGLFSAGVVGEMIRQFRRGNGGLRVDFATTQRGCSGIGCLLLAQQWGMLRVR